MTIDNLKPKLQQRFNEIAAITSIYAEYEWCRKIHDQIEYSKDYDCGLEAKHFKEIAENWETKIKNSILKH
jgi:hypothetical protein